MESIKMLFYEHLSHSDGDAIKTIFLINRTQINTDKTDLRGLFLEFLEVPLKKKEFILERQSGSHAVFIHEDGRRTTVPIHGKRDIGIGMLHQIMKDASLSIEDLSTR